ncbi:MAG: hypothetical protein IKL15_01135 [Mycoplasmataceae bacterium]|nr:hypothetical protein [Mycoplasmataceae bacterium]
MTKRTLFIVIFLILIGIAFLIILFNWEIKNILNAVLEVDSKKDFYLKFNFSNIGLLNSQKSLFLVLEGKQFILEDVEFVYLGNNSYSINFFNDELYKLLKTNSLYEVKILYGSQKIIDFIFNI